jgi:hypothetical protein
VAALAAGNGGNNDLNPGENGEGSNDDLNPEENGDGSSAWSEVGSAQQ